ncbi:MAG: hypothetical protein ACRD0V_02865 [Acidimicrobiales bacterium]
MSWDGGALERRAGSRGARDTEIATEDLSAADREASWRTAISDEFVPVTVGRVTDRDPQGAIRSDSIGRMGLATLTGTPQSILRTRKQINQLDGQCLLVGFLASGAAWIEQDGRQAAVRAGDCVVYEPGRPYEWFFDDDWDLRLFALPLGSVQLTQSERRLVTAVRQAGAQGCASRGLPPARTAGPASSRGSLGCPSAALARDHPRTSRRAAGLRLPSGRRLGWRHEPSRVRAMRFGPGDEQALVMYEPLLAPRPRQAGAAASGGRWLRGLPAGGRQVAASADLSRMWPCRLL